MVTFIYENLKTNPLKKSPNSLQWAQEIRLHFSNLLRTNSNTAQVVNQFHLICSSQNLSLFRNLCLNQIRQVIWIEINRLIRLKSTTSTLISMIGHKLNQWNNLLIFKFNFYHDFGQHFSGLKQLFLIYSKLYRLFTFRFLRFSQHLNTLLTLTENC